MLQNPYRSSAGFFGFAMSDAGGVPGAGGATAGSAGTGTGSFTSVAAAEIA